MPLNAVQTGRPRRPVDADEQRALEEVSSSVIYDSNREYYQSNMQYAMGLKCIACGDRNGARQHFEACLQIPALESPGRSWTRAYLARMDRDPNWPDWIEKQQ